jgi:hypothetical protein
MALIPESEVRVKLNDLNFDTRIVQLGELVLGTEISGTLSISGFADGQVHYMEVEHGPGSGVAREVTFLDNPMPMFNDAAGFIVEPVISGTNGTQFRVKVTYDADEYVYYYGAEPGAGGAVTLNWTRRGIVLLDP